MIGPTPNRSVSDVPEARTASRIRRWDSLSWASRRRTSSRSSTASSWRACSTGVAGWMALEEPIGVRSVEFLGDSARRELGQQGVEAAHDAGCGGCRCRCCASPAAAAPRRGRPPRPRRSVGERNAATATDRASLGSFLFDRPDAKHPHPRRQRGRHIDDVLAGGDELLGQQVAEPARGLDRPRPRSNGSAQANSCVTCARVGAHLHASPARPRRRRSRPRCATPCAGRHR